MTEQDKDVLRRFVAMINAHDLTDLGSVIAPGITEAGPVVVDAPSGGIEAFTAGWQTMLASFPDLAVELDRVVAEVGQVAATLRLTATNTGYYRRGPATGKAANWRGFLVAELRDGLITHLDVQTDRFGILQQLGIIGTDDELATAGR